MTSATLDELPRDGAEITYEVKINVRLAQLVPPHLRKARLTASEIEELERAIGWR